ncbi:MAG: hypothetical protein ACF8MJ_02465 [Phycisphaerales bacterium JB050]
MTGTLRDQRVHGTRSAQTALRCVLLAPEDSTPPQELVRTLEARDAELVLVSSTYEALAALMTMTESSVTPVLLLVEPEQHAERCLELARAAQVFVPHARVWRHISSQTPSLAAYTFPSEASEAEQVAAIRAELRANETPNDRAVRESTAPTLRQVVEDPHDPPSDSATASVITEPETEHEESGLLTADELEMLMDPIYETKPRRGGDPR